MFYECNSLISFPDVSIWHNHSRLTVFNMFYKCNSLISPSDIYEPKISKGKMVGGRDHSTVLHSCAQVEQRMKIDHSFLDEVRSIENSFKLKK